MLGFNQRKSKNPQGEPCGFEIILRSCAFMGSCRFLPMRGYTARRLLWSRTYRYAFALPRSYITTRVNGCNQSRLSHAPKLRRPEQFACHTPPACRLCAALQPQNSRRHFGSRRGPALQCRMYSPFARATAQNLRGSCVLTQPLHRLVCWEHDGFQLKPPAFFNFSFMRFALTHVFRKRGAPCLFCRERLHDAKKHRSTVVPVQRHIKNVMPHFNPFNDPVREPHACGPAFAHPACLYSCRDAQMNDGFSHTRPASSAKRARVMIAVLPGRTQ